MVFLKYNNDNNITKVKTPNDQRTVMLTFFASVGFHMDDAHGLQCERTAWSVLLGAGTSLAKVFAVVFKPG